MRVRAGLVAVAALALCLGCPETRAQRGRDALRLVVRMHREICQAEIRQARAFQFRPEITQARHLGFWPRCRVADTEGLLIQRDLLDHYLALRRGARDEDLPERVRQYLAWRADQAQREMAALDQADRIDTTPLDVLVRQGNREICQEQAAIAQKYLTLAEARGRWTGF